jgi:hypothetical protein
VVDTKNYFELIKRKRKISNKSKSVKNEQKDPHNWYFRLGGGFYIVTDEVGSGLNYVSHHCWSSNVEAVVIPDEANRP